MENAISSEKLRWKLLAQPLSVSTILRCNWIHLNVRNKAAPHTICIILFCWYSLNNRHILYQRYVLSVLIEGVNSLLHYYSLCVRFHLLANFSKMQLHGKRDLHVRINFISGYVWLHQSYVRSFHIYNRIKHLMIGTFERPVNFFLWE